MINESPEYQYFNAMLKCDVCTSVILGVVPDVIQVRCHKHRTYNTSIEDIKRLVGCLESESLKIKLHR